MRLFLFLIFITNALSLTNRYYTKCNYGAPSSGLITASDCREYSADNSYCCLLYYVSNPDVELNFYFKKSDSSKKEKKARRLSERTNLCFGLSKDGYYEIEDVIDELEDESGIDDININCSSRTLKQSVIFLIFLILF